MLYGIGWCNSNIQEKDAALKKAKCGVVSLQVELTQVEREQIQQAAQLSALQVSLQHSRVEIETQNSNLEQANEEIKSLCAQATVVNTSMRAPCLVRLHGAPLRLERRQTPQSD